MMHVTPAVDAMHQGVWPSCGPSSRLLRNPAFLVRMRAAGPSTATCPDPALVAPPALLRRWTATGLNAMKCHAVHEDVARTMWISVVSMVAACTRRQGQRSTSVTSGIRGSQDASITLPQSSTGTKAAFTAVQSRGASRSPAWIPTCRFLTSQGLTAQNSPLPASSHPFSLSCSPRPTGSSPFASKVATSIRFARSRQAHPPAAVFGKFRLLGKAVASSARKVRLPHSM
jgi:hypothetical protein